MGWRQRESEQSKKLVHSHSRIADQSAQRPNRKLLVLRNRKVDPYARLDHHEVATDLSDRFPSRSLEGFGSFSAGDVPQLSHALNGDHDGGMPFALREGSDRLLVLSP